MFKGMGDIRKCSCYRAVKFLQHGMTVVERVLEERLCRKVTVSEVQFGLMPDRGTIDAVFILRMVREENHVKGNNFLTNYYAKCWSGQ